MHNSLPIHKPAHQHVFVLILNEKKLECACSQMDFVSVPSGRRDLGGGWVSKKLLLSDSVPLRPYPSSHNLGNLIL